MGIMSALFGSYSKRELKRIDPLCKSVLALEEKYRAMNESDLKAVTPALKERLAKGETLDDILPDAFAACREASDRALGMRHFPVQVIGGIVLHQGRIAEMKTGEGKTLVATLPSYLNALEGKGVHVVTVNDYLARRDSEWMGKVYRYLGLTVGLIVHGMDNDERRNAYGCDITYATNNELGFDYLRDNMVIYKENRVQRGHHYAIVDEVDSILVDEARTPLIISGQGDKSTDLYARANQLAKSLKMYKTKELDDKQSHDDIDGDYIVDEKAKTSTLTPSGVQKAERFFGIENLMDADNMTVLHHVNQAIRAHGIMQRDVDYVVKDDAVIIVDEFTGRLMFGRRYNEGLHQAIEAKENVKIERESKTLATITFQNYFRQYNKLAGMTGTAMTEESEFSEIYKLDVVEIPTNRPMVREDRSDTIYKTETAKFNAVIDQISECHEKGQPVLVGTISIEKSEELSHLLKKRGIAHAVLNAKHHHMEAEIVAQAGKKGAVTIATNMAGRGTDIVLGGNAEYLAKSEMRRLQYSEEMINEATGFAETDDAELLEARTKYRELNDQFKKDIKKEAELVKEAGGLFIVGTERHESRRIDNQLRGRAGRQGDPGATRFYLSLGDDLMRLFGGERISNLMNTLRIEDDMPIENPIVSNAIENAQKKVETRNFGIRKNVLQFDDVMNRQREIIYSQRNKVLDGESVFDSISKMISEAIEADFARYVTGSIADNWNLGGLRDHFMGWLTTDDDFRYTTSELENCTPEFLLSTLQERATELYAKREAEFGSETMREVERVVLLRTVDTKWMDHIDDMEELKKGISLRAYGQKDPVVEYRIEGFDMFDSMIESIKEDTARLVLTVQVRRQEEPKREQVAKPIDPATERADPGPRGIRRVGSTGSTFQKSATPGRNEYCPCGSGKKYKKCCGASENTPEDTPESHG